MQHTFLFLDILSLAAILWVECGLFYSLCIFPCFSPHFILFPHQFPTSLRAARRLVCFFLSNHLQTQKTNDTDASHSSQEYEKMIVAALACLWLNSAFGSLCSMFWTVFSSSFPFCCGLNECPALHCTAWPKSGACQSKCAQSAGGLHGGLVMLKLSVFSHMSVVLLRYQHVISKHLETSPHSLTFTTAQTAMRHAP